MHALRSADRERLEELLEEMFRFIEDNKWAEKSMIVNLLYGLLNETSLLFYNTNLSELDEGTAGALLLSLPDYRSVRGYARSFFEKAISIIQDKKGNKEEYVVRKVEQIVMERFNSDISIKTIAAEIYLSPNYLGSIFKKSMGVPFNDYLCQYRMEKAKELLKSPKNKVSKVAAEVGIPNSSYFCQLFKEMFGIAPGEYQDRILRGNI
jgi:two-component system response regulator YesN